MQRTIAKFTYGWKVYIVITYLLSVVFGIYKLIEDNMDKFLVEVESDIDLQGLANIPSHVWNLNLLSLKDQILSLREIKSVDLKVILPNKVYITTQKRKPIAVWWDYERFFLVDDYGVIVSDIVSEKDKKDHTFIVGIGAIENLKRITGALTLSNYNGKVASMRFVGKRRWDIVLSNGTLIKLPEKNEKEALRLLDKLLHSKDHLVVKGDIVDMRLAPKKVFLKRQKNVER